MGSLKQSRNSQPPNPNTTTTTKTYQSSLPPAHVARPENVIVDINNNNKAASRREKSAFKIVHHVPRVNDIGNENSLLMAKASEVDQGTATQRGGRRGPRSLRTGGGEDTRLEGGQTEGNNASKQCRNLVDFSKSSRGGGSAAYTTRGRGRGQRVVSGWSGGS